MRLGDAILGEARRVEKGLTGGEVARRRYPWKECMADGEGMGLSKEGARDRCLYVACCVSRLPNKVKEGGGCRAVDCDRPPRGVSRPGGAGGAG